SQKPQTFARDVVLDFLDGVHLLRAGVIDTDGLIEQLAVPLDGDVNVFVNRGAENRAVSALIEVREVRSPAGETDPQRSPRNDESGRVAGRTSQASGSNYKEYPP